MDVIVVGAGAAGFLAAIMAKREKPSLKVFLLDTRTKIGAKILISGGTRCNVTHRQVFAQDYQGGARHFIKHVLEAFPSEKTIDFFKELGVELVLEPTGKYFPTTHSGKTILEALVREAHRLEIELVTGVKIERIKALDEGFVLEDTLGKSWQTRRVVLATGGLSYPETGSDGTGLRMAESLGHHVVDTFPALTPLLSGDEAWQSLSGVALETELSFYRQGKKAATARGALLFTHFGYSGPVALDISRHFAACPKEDQPEIRANFIPGMDEATVEALVKSTSISKHWLKNFLDVEFDLPQSFVDVFIQKNNLDPEALFSKLSRADKRKILECLRQAPLGVTGVVGYKKAEVTAGGVDLKEIRHQTMESRLVPGLYFAGEIVDVEGRIGGFNFQWAWSSGRVAGRALAKSFSAWSI